MANMIPLIKSGGFFASRYWTPLVIGNGLTTTGGDTPDPPVQKTVSGSIVHITDALAAPAIALSTAINPAQSGSGDPSPTNVRSISGFSAANIVVSPTTTAGDGTTYTVSFGSAGTVYGGTLDVVNGTLTVDKTYIPVKGAAAWAISSQNFFYAKISAKAPGTENVISDIYTTKSRASWETGDDFVISGNSSTGQIYIRDSRFTTQADFRANADGNMCFELATPQTYTLTPTEVQLLLGANNVWSDTNGDVTLTYLADGNVSASSALNMLLGGTYTPSADVSDREALQIIMGETT